MIILENALKEHYKKTPDQYFPLEYFQKLKNRDNASYADLADAKYSDPDYKTQFLEMALQYFLLDFKKTYIPKNDGSKESFQKELYLRKRWIQAPLKEIMNQFLDFNEQSQTPLENMQGFLQEMITIQNQSIALQTISSFVCCLLSLVQSIVGFFTGPIEILGTICTAASIGLGFSTMIATKALGATKTKDLKKHSLEDENLVLEMDFLRILLQFDLTDQSTIMRMTQQFLTKDDFKEKPCQILFSTLLKNSPQDLQSLASGLQVKDQVFLSDLLQKKIQKENVTLVFVQTLEKILSRNLGEKRAKIQSGQASTEEAFTLSRELQDISEKLQFLSSIEARLTTPNAFSQALSPERNG